VIIRLARNNRERIASVGRLVGHKGSAESVAEQAKAAQDPVEEMCESPEVTVRPLLVLLNEPPPGIRDLEWAAVRVFNAGTGPALNVVVWMYDAAGNIYRSAGAEAMGFAGALHLGSAETFEPGPTQNMLYVDKLRGHLDPGPDVVGKSPSTNIAAYCADQLGNRFRFSLRTGGPPDIWRRGADPPPWANAWDPPLALGVLARLPANAVTTSTPGRDLSQLLEELHDVLHDVQDAAAGD
jgi:hypothetical protein